MLVLAGLLVSVLVLTAFWAVSYSKAILHQWKLEQKFPGPRGWPILGNCLSFTGSSVDTFNIFLGWMEKYGKRVRVRLGPKLCIFLTDPDDLKIVLGNDKIRNKDFHMSLAIKPFFGESLGISRDEKWRQNRKLINPAFHFKILESYVEIFSRKAEILSEKIRDLADGRTTDISHQLSLCTLDSICETAIGINMDIQRKDDCEFAKAVSETLALVHQRAIRPWLLLDWLYPWTADGKAAERVIQTLHQFSDNVIASKLASHKNGDLPKHSSKTGSDKRVSSFLDLLINTSTTEGHSLTPEDIRNEVSILAGAGMESTAYTMAQVLVLLGMYPEYQDKVNQELASIFQDGNRNATPEDLQKMKILEYVIKEILRLFPAVTIMSREIKEDLEISNGYILPAGCSAVGLSYVTHRNPDYYPDPERFWPERWSPENSVGRHPYAFLPFSAGARNCIGHKYAMLVMKATLSYLLRRYRFTCDCYTMKDLEQFELSATLRSAVGYKLQIHTKTSC